MHFQLDICVVLVEKLIVATMDLIIVNSYLEHQWKKHLKKRLVCSMLL